MVNASSNEKLIRLLEEQLANTNQQNKDLSEKLDKAIKQNEALTEQLRHLTKLLFGSKTESSKYNAPDGQTSLWMKRMSKLLTVLMVNLVKPMPTTGSTEVYHARGQR